MKNIILILSLLFSVNIFATEASVSQDEVQLMLDQMVSQGSISSEQAKAAKERLLDMNSQEFGGLVDQASEVMKKNGNKMPSRAIASE